MRRSASAVHSISEPHYSGPLAWASVASSRSVPLRVALLNAHFIVNMSLKLNYFFISKGLDFLFLTWQRCLEYIPPNRPVPAKLYFVGGWRIRLGFQELLSVQEMFCFGAPRC